MKREFQTKLQEMKKQFYELQQDYSLLVKRGPTAEKNKLLKETKLLKEGVAVLQQQRVVRHPLKVWFWGMLASTYHHCQQVAGEVELLESYFAAPWADPPMSYELDLLDQLDIARDALRRFVSEKGACEACDAQKQRLTRIESGHKLCDVCLNELNADLPAYPRASRKEIAKCRMQGFDVPDGVSILDCWKYDQILLRRQHGLRDDAPYEELFNYLLACGLSRGGKWDWYCETSVVGGKYPNPDGTSRLEILRRCRVGERLVLVREPENIQQEDLRAVKVCRKTGEQLGYIPTHLLGNDKNLGYCLANQMDRGDLFQATLQTISAKCEGSFGEFELKDGENIGDIITKCERQRGFRFVTSTVTARIDVYWLNCRSPDSERIEVFGGVLFQPDGSWPETQQPNLTTQKDIKALKRRIEKLRKQGVSIDLDAVFPDCWKHEQALLRRSLGLQEDASHDMVVECIYQQRQSRSAVWKQCDLRSWEYIALAHSITTEASYLQMIDRCRVGDRVVLIRHPQNSWLYRVSVHRENGELIGDVAAPQLADRMDSGTPLDARIARIHQPFPGQLFSLSVCIEVRMFVLPDDSAS